MNRRNFLRGVLGSGAVASVAPLLPSEVWPFKKIFLPALHDSVQGIEWEYFSKEFWTKAILKPLRWQWCAGRDIFVSGTREQPRIYSQSVLRNPRGGGYHIIPMKTVGGMDFEFGPSVPEEATDLIEWMNRKAQEISGYNPLAKEDCMIREISEELNASVHTITTKRKI